MSKSASTDLSRASGMSGRILLMLVGALVLLSVLGGCSAYATDKAAVEKALEANVAQAAVFHRHSSAFERIIRSATMAEPVKSAVLDLIEQDREAFDALNRGVERSIGVLGALTLGDIQAIADKLQELYKAVKNAVAKPKAGEGTGT